MDPSPFRKGGVGGGRAGGGMAGNGMAGNGGFGNPGNGNYSTGPPGTGRGGNAHDGTGYGPRGRAADDADDLIYITHGMRALGKAAMRSMQGNQQPYEPRQDNYFPAQPTAPGPSSPHVKAANDKVRGGKQPHNDDDEFLPLFARPGHSAAKQTAAPGYKGPRADPKVWETAQGKVIKQQVEKRLRNEPPPAQTGGYFVVKTLQAPNPGGMSRGVYLVKHEDGKQWVEKRLAMDKPELQQRSDNERFVLMQIKAAVKSHVHLNAVKEAVWKRESPTSTLILEYCDGGSLQDGIETMTRTSGHIMDSFAVHILFGIAKGLTMLHHGIPDYSRPRRKVIGWNTICHLDIKPANILLSHDVQLGPNGVTFPRVVIADFGCSITRIDVEANREGKIVQEHGTPGWFPPDMPDIEAHAQLGRYGKPTDIWQAGGVIQTVCRLTSQPNLFMIRKPCGDSYSAQLNCLVATCLATDYRRRPTAIDLCNEIRNQVALRERLI